MIAEGVDFIKVEVPSQQRDTKLVKDVPVEEIAADIVAWLNSDRAGE